MSAQLPLVPMVSPIVSGSNDKTVRLWKPNWKTWLQAACNQLREHSILVKDKSAGDTCLKMGGWSDKEKEQFRQRQKQVLVVKK